MRSGAGEARSAIVAFQQMRRDRAGAGAFHAWAQAHPFLPVPGTLGHVDHAHRAGRLGHGRQWLGGGLGPQDDADSIGAIRLAVDRGINWIDTAAVYGLGHSEEIVRRALAQMAPSERPYVFTKCGLTWSDAQPQATPRRTGAPASIRREVEDSLRRLGVERIDLYQMHWPAGDGTSLDGYWNAAGAQARGQGRRGGAVEP